MVKPEQIPRVNCKDVHYHLGHSSQNHLQLVLASQKNSYYQPGVAKIDTSTTCFNSTSPTYLDHVHQNHHTCVLNQLCCFLFMWCPIPYMLVEKNIISTFSPTQLRGPRPTRPTCTPSRTPTDKSRLTI